MIIVVGVSSVYNICFLLENGTPIIILLCVNDNCRGRFICLYLFFSSVRWNTHNHPPGVSTTIVMGVSFRSFMNNFNLQSRYFFALLQINFPKQ